MVPRLLLVLLLTLAATAQPGESELDELLDWQDQQIVERYSADGSADHRWDGLLQSLAEQLVVGVSQVFPGQGQPVSFRVFRQKLGFNAVCWHRVVIVDSLLMEGLERLSQGQAVYGKLDTPYTESILLQIGMERPELPPPPGLTWEREQQGRKLFEEVLAAWICHEVSHAYLGHARERLRQARRLEQGNPRVNPLLLDQQIRNYLDYRLGPSNELEADRYGARLALRSGFGLEGYRRALWIIARLEKLSGADASFYRTHPQPEERTRILQEVEAEESQERS